MFMIKSARNLRLKNSLKPINKLSFSNKNIFKFKNLNIHYSRKFFATINDNNFNTKTQSKHIDSKDDEHFKSIKDWWNPDGSMYTLHVFNSLRVEYILNSLKNIGKVKENIKNKNLKLGNFNGLDIGCGAGILTEVKFNIFFESKSFIGLSYDSFVLLTINISNFNKNIIY